MPSHTEAERKKRKAERKDLEEFKKEIGIAQTPVAAPGIIARLRAARAGKRGQGLQQLNPGVRSQRAGLAAGERQDKEEAARKRRRSLLRKKDN